MPSKNFSKKKDAIEQVEALATVEEVKAFIEGEERSEVVAAQIRIDALKQGQEGTITKKSADFKGGVQGTKEPSVPKDYVTGEDVLKALRAKGYPI